jgi:hypothetical protein
MGRIVNLDTKYNNYIIFSIIFFIIYMIVTCISDYILGRKIKAILIYSSLFFSIIISSIGIINMLYYRKINYKKLLLLCIPFIYIIVAMILGGSI